MTSYEYFMKTFSRILEQDGVVYVTVYGHKTYAADCFERLPGKADEYDRPRLQLTLNGKEVARINLQRNVQLSRSPVYHMNMDKLKLKQNRSNVMEKDEGRFYVEHLAAREGLDLSEYFAGIVRTKGNWNHFDKSYLTIVHEKEPPLLTITIDGSKDVFKTGDVLEWLTESDISDMHNVASFTKALLRIVPSEGKNLSIEFIWADVDEMVKAVDDAFSKILDFGLDVFGWG